MKRFQRVLLLGIIALFAISQVVAQAPARFNYQAIVRDSEGQIIVSEDVIIDFAIRKGTMDGTQVFHESHATATSELGLVVLEIGSIESLEGIDWGDDDYFLEVSVNSEIMGTTQLASVPFALFAQSSADSFSGDYEDLENVPEGFINIENPNDGDMAVYTSEGWTVIPAGSDNQLLVSYNGTPQWTDYPEPVTDIDGNVYPTVVLGNQEWFARDLRTTRFKDGTPLETYLAPEEWVDMEVGAYVVYDHTIVEGIDSEEEMVEAYSKFYSGWAVLDERGVCPEGWRVPSNDDWNELISFISNEYGYHNDTGSDDPLGVGNALKSCRQIDSPLEECDVADTDHPRWSSHDTHYGFDRVGMSIIPSGTRYWNTGHFALFGQNITLWTTTPHPQDPEELLFIRRLTRGSGGVFSMQYSFRQAAFIRCMRDVE